MKAKVTPSSSVAYGATMAILVAGMAALVFSQPAAATVKFATDTGKACGVCHVSASSGGKLTEFGEKFKANGYKLP